MDFFINTRMKLDERRGGPSDLNPDMKGKVDPAKSRIPHFPSISQALTRLDYGGVFTTPASDRIYVVTRGTWGKKSQNKVVKGFPSTTPLSTIRAYGERTKSKHGTSKKVAGGGASEEEKGKSGFSTKKFQGLKKRFIAKK